MINAENIIETIKRYSVLTILDIKITEDKYINFTTSVHPYKKSKNNYNIEIQILSQTKFRITFDDFEAMNHIKYLLSTFDGFIYTFNNSGIFYSITLEEKMPSRFCTITPEK